VTLGYSIEPTFQVAPKRRLRPRRQTPTNRSTTSQRRALSVGLCDDVAADSGDPDQPYSACAEPSQLRRGREWPRASADCTRKGALSLVAIESAPPAQKARRDELADTSGSARLVLVDRFAVPDRLSGARVRLLDRPNRSDFEPELGRPRCRRPRGVPVVTAQLLLEPQASAGPARCSARRRCRRSGRRRGARSE
jgi:hypothetical protein